MDSKNASAYLAAAERIARTAVREGMALEWRIGQFLLEQLMN